MIFTEDSRVKIPCILHLVRLGYQYTSLKSTTWDEETNIFPELFLSAIARINPGIDGEDIERLLADIKLLLDNEDLGKAFYERLSERSGALLIDFAIKDTSLRKYPAGTVLLSSRAPIGYMAIAREELTTNQGFKSFIPTNGYSTVFIFYTVKNSLKAITQYASGSTFKEISGTALKTVKVCLPDSAIVEQFTNSFDPIFKRQNLLEQENQHLTQLRDWLLPMLMNGQITVA